MLRFAGYVVLFAIAVWFATEMLPRGTEGVLAFVGWLVFAWLPCLGVIRWASGAPPLGLWRRLGVSVPNSARSIDRGTGLQLADDQTFARFVASYQVEKGRMR